MMQRVAGENEIMEIRSGNDWVVQANRTRKKCIRGNHIEKLNNKIKCWIELRSQKSKTLEL